MLRVEVEMLKVEMLGIKVEMLRVEVEMLRVEVSTLGRVCTPHRARSFTSRHGLTGSSSWC